MTEHEIQETRTTLSQLNSRAIKVGYKNKTPHLPKNISPSTMSGYRKRLQNWTTGLVYLEKNTATLGIQVDPQLLRNYLNS